MDNISFAFVLKSENYITFSVSVNSGCFSGKSNFCLSQTTISTVIEALRLLNRELAGEYSIFDSDSDDFVQISFKKYGHLRISGQLGGSFNKEYLVYCFDSDQTLLTQIIESLQQFVESN